MIPPSTVHLSTLEKVGGFCQSQSLWYFHIPGGCCADELLNTFGCRYDLERFGCRPVLNPQHADLLLISGGISQKAAPYLQTLYHEMPSPKYVVAIGACAITGGLFAPQQGGSSLPGLDSLIPIDVYIPGCPPRPEAIMNGLIALQEKVKQRAFLPSV